MSTSSNGIDQPPEMRDNDFFTDIPSGHKLPLGWVECAWQPEVTTKQQALCNEPGRLVATNGGTPAMTSQAAVDEATMGAAVTPHYSYRNWGINE